MVVRISNVFFLALGLSGPAILAVGMFRAILA